MQTNIMWQAPWQEMIIVVLLYFVVAKAQNIETTTQTEEEEKLLKHTIALTRRGRNVGQGRGGITNRR